jgi:hypothetical protein
MVCCENCSEGIGQGEPHAEVEVTPKNGLSDVLEGYEAALCVECIKEKQRSMNDDRELSRADIDTVESPQAVADGGLDDDSQSESSSSAS